MPKITPVPPADPLMEAIQGVVDHVTTGPLAEHYPHLLDLVRELERAADRARDAAANADPLARNAANLVRDLADADDAEHPADAADPKGLTFAVRELERLEKLLEYEREVANRRCAEIGRQIEAHRLALENASRGLDAVRIELAEEVLEIRGGMANRGGVVTSQRKKKVRQAMGDIADTETPGGVLWETYRGVKNYDRFGDQGFDARYGMSPRHGDIVFSVGFRREFRQREPRQITPEQVEACIYYLAKLELVQEAQRAAFAAPKGGD